MPTTANQRIRAFIVGRLLAEQVGLKSSQATQWGIVLTLLGGSPASILLVAELARFDAMQLSAEQPDPQAQLIDKVQQAVQQAQETAAAAIRATAQIDQIGDRVERLNDRIVKLEAGVSELVGSQNTSDKILATLRDIQDSINSSGSGIPPRRRRRGARYLLWLRHHLFRLLSRRFMKN
ncbi:hypothetical protein [Myxacorys almedinensis]|uniref:Uncharacterized protein n=1 Tax=Myxacorys almedinensis A TaxID=2690445 RepID=A0A8J7YXG2_9CYAN|nr:hypothetical protein [Myxacorys almedinensis]NDJ16437.1 hypothetical protein [Myxacorys almedinensis A]